ncbi:CBS domain-containing protein [Candidatus Woesearchaeota archaeon]|nr:CBS domain-containing protein [Candidatus Woesearchaeota archaeon]
MPNIPRKEQAKLMSEQYEIDQLCAKDAMIKPVFLFPEDSSETILKKLKKEHVNSCIVISKERKFIGEISDNDIIKLFLHQTRFEPLVKILNRGYRREFIHKKAKDLANKHKHSVNLETPINEVIKLVYRKGFEYVPVLDSKEKVVGVITPSSLIDLLEDY